MNYAIEQRIRFIDCMLDYYGCIGRAELIDFFGIGEATATRDFGIYTKSAPSNMLYNVSTKRYVKSDSFARLY